MAYNIKVRGETEPIYVEDDVVAQKLEFMWIEYRSGKANNGILKIGEYTGSISDITGFRRVPKKVPPPLQPSDRKQLDYDISPETVEKNKIYTKKLLDEYRKIHKKA